MAVSNVLKHLKVDFKGVNVLEDENLEKELKNLVIGHYTSTLCKGEFIGGCDIVKEMFEKGNLVLFLKKKNYLIFLNKTNIRVF